VCDSIGVTGRTWSLIINGFQNFDSESVIDNISRSLICGGLSRTSQQGNLYSGTVPPSWVPLGQWKALCF
jgi:hypothetical protein